MTRAVALGWSGGKDSSLALAALRADPDVDVVALLTTVTRGYDRISIHGVRRALLHEQAAAVGVRLHEVEIEPACTNADYERAFLDGLARLRAEHPAVEAIAFGDLFLRDVREYRERLLAPTGLAPLFPLWDLDTRVLAHRFIDEGYVARLVCVDAQQLDASFAGRLFDRRLLADLPASADPCGERGEFHTFVSDGPIFSRPVGYETGEIVMRDGRFAYCDLLHSAMAHPLQHAAQ